MILLKDIYAKAAQFYSTTAEKNAYTRGFIDGAEEAGQTSASFLSDLADLLLDLWPKGMKNPSVPWTPGKDNLVQRLSFVWRERKYGERFSLDDCRLAALRYISSFDGDYTYMQTLKNFVFRQETLHDSRGKATFTFSSIFCDLLEEDYAAHLGQLLEENKETE